MSDAAAAGRGARRAAGSHAPAARRAARAGRRRPRGRSRRPARRAWRSCRTPSAARGAASKPKLPSRRISSASSGSRVKTAPPSPAAIGLVAWKETTSAEPWAPIGRPSAATAPKPAAESTSSGTPASAQIASQASRTSGGGGVPKLDSAMHRGDVAAPPLEGVGQRLGVEVPVVGRDVDEDRAQAVPDDGLRRRRERERRHEHLRRAARPRRRRAARATSRPLVPLTRARRWLRSRRPAGPQQLPARPEVREPASARGRARGSARSLGALGSDGRWNLRGARAPSRPAAPRHGTQPAALPASPACLR